MAIGQTNKTFNKDESREIAQQIATLLQEIRYGSVEVVVHDGRVVQIDKRERFRLNEPR